MSDQLAFNFLSEVEISLAEDGSSPIRLSEFGQACQELFRDSNGDVYVIHAGIHTGQRAVAHWTEYEMSVLFPNKQSAVKSKAVSWHETETCLIKIAGLE